MKNFFKTSDFGLCVVLCVLGFKLTSIDKTNPNRAIFQFENDVEIEKYTESYFRGELRLDPRLVLLQSRLVKSRLKQGF